MAETVNDTSVVVEDNTDTTTDTDTDTTVDNVTDEDINLTIDDLLALTEEDYEEFSEDAHHKGMQPLTSWMKHVPADVRKHIANLRSDYTRKTQELSSMRRELEDQKRVLSDRNQQVLNGDLASQLRNIDIEKEYDLFDPEGMKSEIKRQAALMLKDMLEPAQKELEINARKLQLEQFKAEHPDMMDPQYKTEIVQLLQSRPELKLEDAYFITKSRLDSEKLAEERARLESDKRSRRDTARKSNSGTRANVSAPPKFKNAIEAYQWHKANQSK